ncbi:MAG: acetolactate synthase large subunit, partial [Mycobacterium sp.]|nr:acetolactate synthase large subunit [Mycobacterium sp.]
MSAPTTRPPEPAQRANGAPAAAKVDIKAPRTVAPQKVTGAQAVIRSLEELDVEIIFGIPGGAVLPVYDPLFDSQKLRHVLV